MDDLSSTEEHRALQNQHQYCGQLVRAYGTHDRPADAGAPTPSPEIPVPDRQVYFYTGQEVATGGGVRNSASSVPSGLSGAAAAAVAAFDHLARVAGKMGAAEKAGGPGTGQMQGGLTQFNPQFEISRSSYIVGGGGRRGRRDRGRGRGKPRMISSSHEIGAFAHENDNADSKEVRPPAEAPGEAGGSQQPARAWCELCRVECSSLQVLEQHSNGKRHKKNLEMVHLQPRTDQRIQQGFQQREINGNCGTEVDKSRVNPGIAMQSSGNLLERKPPESSGLGMKRKTEGVVGVGNKRIKNLQPHKPKVVITLTCDICNIRCNTKEVLDCHFSGKKHMAKLKRLEDQQARYGPPGLQALYPPNPITDTTLYSHDHRLPAFDYGPQTSAVITETTPYSQDHQLPAFGYGPQTSTVMTETTPYSQDHQLSAFGYGPQTSAVMTETTPYSQDHQLPAFGYGPQTSAVMTETTPYSQDHQLPAFGYGPQTSTAAISQTYPGIATSPSVNPSIQHYYY